MTQTIRAVVIGFHEYTPYLLSTLSDNPDVELSALISQTKRSVNGCCPEEAANCVGVEFVITDSLDTNKIKNYLIDKDIHLGVCLGWYEVISEEILTIPQHGIIGVHAAPLPEGRGQAPVNYQIIYGMENATVSVFQFDSAVDAGDLLGQRSVPIFSDENVDSLYNRLLYHGVNILDNSIKKLSNDKSITEPQSDTNATYWPERRPSDSLIDWDFDSDQLDQFIRALTGSYPNAFTYHKQKKLRITQATSYPGRTSSSDPGEVIGTQSNEALLVQTGSGVLGIERIGLLNEPIISGKEMASQLDLSPNDTLCDDTDFPDDFVYTGVRGSGGKLDLKLKTNTAVGSPAKNHVYCFAPQAKQKMRILVEANNQTLLDETKQVIGHKKLPFSYTPKNEGSSFIKISFPNTPQEPRHFFIYSHS